MAREVLNLPRGLSLAFALCALALPAVGCLDWDALRDRGEAGPADGGDADAATPAKWPEPVVEWAFSRLAEGVVPDLAPLAPVMTLRELSDDPLHAAAVSQGELRLGGAMFEATVDATFELGQVLSGADKAFSFELWFRDARPTAQGDPDELVRIGEALSILLTPDGIAIVVLTTTGPIDPTLPHRPDQTLHHFVMTFTPGATSLLSIYVDGATASVRSADDAKDATQMTWVPRGGRIRVGESNLRELSVGSAAWFARALTAPEVAARYHRGPTR